MIHKFVANDNKGNVNVLEVTSTGTKLGKVAPPVEDTDAATKKYVDDNTGGKYIVTLTPTSPDYSGTMDKTVAEINAAYEAGQEIVFRIYAAATLYYDLPCSNVEANSANNYFIMGAFGIMNDLLILFKTHDQEGDGTGQTYKTTIYSLTPAS